MKNLFIYISIAIIAIILSHNTLSVRAEAETEPLKKPDPPKKPYKNVTSLQVGVRHRPDPCTKKASNGDELSVHYAGYLAENLKPFDDSYSRGSPFKFTIGASQVIKGWDIGLMGACLGEKRRLVIPYNMAYGERGSPPVIPSKSALVFDVSVEDIQSKKQDF